MHKFEKYAAFVNTSQRFERASWKWNVNVKGFTRYPPYIYYADQSMSRKLLRCLQNAFDNVKSTDEKTILTDVLTVRMIISE